MSDRDLSQLKQKINLGVGHHSRLSEFDRLVYPVVSRRAKGLSLGINLNTDKRCSFNCIYCQVDRTTPTDGPQLSIEQISTELSDWLDDLRKNGGKYDGYPLKDISIAGDGEPTHVAMLGDVLSMVMSLKKAYQFDDVKLVLLTNGSNLQRTDLKGLWKEFFKNQGEVWFKLDFWDEESFKQINRSKVPMKRVLDNFLWLSSQYPVVIQSCFFRRNNEPYSNLVYEPYTKLIQELLRKGAHIEKIQAYTLARKPAEEVYPWTNEEMDSLQTYLSEAISVPIEKYYEKG